ncbi:MAG: glycosyl hydrolase family 5, partial [Candidatus Eremiobacteraeota bacterium]|nr:glycosyl hydrolase family 5 [Candidatus Eremiobacteraeota bacterium]
NAITRGRPVMYPIPMLYSTPANAVAEVRYLRARGYPVAYVEMGEEADGQYVNPEDYAALYVQFARALHAFDPTLKLGGPVFEGVNIDVAAWADASGDTSFLHRFLRYLKRHGALGELAFMSFEHYPFKGCDRGALLHEDLLREPAMIRDIAHIWRADGLPVNVPMFVTEGHFAADGTSVPLRLEGALWMADYFGSAFSSGVTRIQHYQYEAEPIGRSSECGISTSYGMFITDAKYRIVAKAGSFYGAQMLAKEWLVPGDAPHDIYPVTNSLGTYEPAVTGYAAHRPDGTWSMLLVNKDRVARRVRITLGAGTLRGPVTIVSFGSAQYHWNDRHGAIPPSWSTGPVRRVVQADAAGIYTIPAESVTVVRGAASGG